MTLLRSLAAGADFRLFRTFSPIAGTAIVLTLFGIAVLFLARRLSGALAEPLPIGVYAILGLVLAATAVLVRRTLAEAPIDRIPDGVVRAAASAVAVAAAVAVSLATTPAFGLLLLWLPIALEEGWAWRHTSTIKPRPLVAPESPTDRPLAPRRDQRSRLYGVADDAELALADSAVTQHLVRRLETTGEESISGFLRAAFIPGQQTVNLHVAFCPPVATILTCSAETIDGPAARVRVAQVLPHGARLEVKLDSPATELQHVLIEFSATEPPRDR